MARKGMSRDMARAVAFARLAAKAYRVGNMADFQRYSKLEAHYRGIDARAKARANSHPKPED